MTWLNVVLSSWAVVATSVAVGKHLAHRRALVDVDRAMRTIANMAVHLDPTDATAAGALK